MLDGRSIRRLGFVLVASCVAMACSAAMAQSTWVATTATGNATLTQSWSTSANWNPASVPDAVGATVIFSGTWNQGTNTIQLPGSATTTIGSITMTNIGTGTTATTGKFNLAATAGTATLKLDTGAATQPSINYTTGGQFDNFLNVVLSGTQGYEKAGAGIIQVSGFNNTYTGTTKITAGGVRFIRNANLGDPSTAGPIQLNGGTLYLRSDAGSVALDNRAAFTDAPGSAKRNVSVTAGTSGAPANLNLELTAGGTTVLEITGNLTSSASGVYFRKSGGGTLNLKGSANNMLGVTQFDSGTTNMSGVFDTNGSVSIAVSNNASSATAPTPVVNWTGGGTVASGNASLVVNDAGVNATPSLTVTSGTLTIGNGVSTGGLYVGGKGSGTATVDGGLLIVTANKVVSLGAFLQYGSNNGFGTLTIQSGTMRASGAGEFNVGFAQTNVTASGTFAGKGVLNLSGGVLETGRSLVTGTSAQATASGTVNFNGGVLRALATNTNFMTVTTANVLGGGAVIDTNSYDVTIAQSIVNGGAGGLTKRGLGVLTLTASNSYVGSTVISGGTLKAGNANAFGAAGITIASGATLDLNSLAVANAVTNNGGTLANAGAYAGTQTLAGAATYSALAGTLSVASGGAATLEGAVTGTVSIAAGGSATLAAGGSLAQSGLSNNGTFTVNRGDNLSLGIVISGSGGLAKLGSGTLTLTGSNTYTGNTTVSAGRLAVNGVLGSGSLSVAAAAWLAGNGTINGPVSVQGTLGPGNSPGLLTMKSLELVSSSTTAMEIAGTSRGTSYDAIDIADSSGIIFGGSLKLTFTSLFPDNTTFNLFAFSGSPSGSFSSVSAAGSYGALTFVKQGGVWTAQSGSQTLTFTESSGNVLVVPEPAAPMLLVAGGFAAAVCRARRRRNFA
ncbi:MAG: beta strand repeat-containing protein [Planctomycetaceae bacterium]